MICLDFAINVAEKVAICCVFLVNEFVIDYYIISRHFREVIGKWLLFFVHQAFLFLLSL